MKKLNRGGLFGITEMQFDENRNCFWWDREGDYDWLDDRYECGCCTCCGCDCDWEDDYYEDE